MATLDDLIRQYKESSRNEKPPKATPNPDHVNSDESGNKVVDELIDTPASKSNMVNIDYTNIMEIFSGMEFNEDVMTEPEDTRDEEDDGVIKRIEGLGQEKLTDNLPTQNVASYEKNIEKMEFNNTAAQLNQEHILKDKYIDKVDDNKNKDEEFFSAIDDLYKDRTISAVKTTYENIPLKMIQVDIGQVRAALPRSILQECNFNNESVIKTALEKMKDDIVIRGAMEKILELADDIRKNGLLQPIGVVMKKDIYQIIYGERRFWASMYNFIFNNGSDTISAIIYPGDISNELQIHMQWAENMQRVDIPPGRLVEIVCNIYTNVFDGLMKS
ncbi:MAG: ParB N-terminal domain-containing protein, partial [Methylacidiphilales bacterium]|nr:ParB N-terminal domain-containing protein [Candidatus Methylacidiphilales bacterium]